MDLAAMALASLASKMGNLLKEEYKLATDLRKQVASLSQELDSTHIALCKVADLPPDQLDPQISIWGREVGAASHDMEGVIDIFLMPMEERPEPADPDRLTRHLKKMGSLFKEGKALNKIATTTEEGEIQVQDNAERRGKLKVNDMLRKPSMKPSPPIDPYLLALCTKESLLDGVDEPRDVLIRILSVADNEAYNKKMKILSIVRSEGLGKTTLAQEVFDKLKPQFDCGAFVQVGQNPDLKKVFTDILIGLDKKKYTNSPLTILDLMELIGLLRKSLMNKRFFIVVDDIWDSKAWDIIKYALAENSNGSAVLTTSRDKIITEFIGGKLPPLSSNDCKQIFCQKLFGSPVTCPPELEEVLGKLIDTCGGVLSVIIDTVELLASKEQTLKDWQAVYDRRMFALSYPSLLEHLKNCLLYFSLFGKGYKIRRERLVWGWIAERFVQDTQGQTLQKAAESYLSELIMKGMIEAVEVDAGGQALSCRVYDFVHEFIISKSAETKFAAILDGPQVGSLPDAVHRLSINGSNVVQSLPQGLLSQVRSLVISADTVPSLSVFKDLCVLDLRDCDSLQDDHLKGIRNLIYLVIGGKCITGIPKEIGNLKHLQTLDLSASDLNELPESVFLLRELERLYVNSHMKIPDGIRKLSSLQEVGDINIIKPALLKEFCDLINLRVLRVAIWSWDQSLKSSVKQLRDNLRSLVQNSKSIQSLSILTCCSLDFMDDLVAEGATPILQKLEIRYSCFHTLPTWIGSLLKLSLLSIEVYQLSQVIISLLGTKLPALHSLSLTSKHVPQGMFGINPDEFKKLESLKFVSNDMVQMFAQQPAAMKQLRRLTFTFQASRTKDINRGFNFGLENLHSLDHIRVEIICLNASCQVVENAEAAIWAIYTDQSRRPNLEIRRIQEETMAAEESSSVASSARRDAYSDKSRLPAARRSARQQPNQRKITDYFTSISSTAPQQPNQRKITDYFTSISRTTNIRLYTS